MTPEKRAKLRMEDYKKSECRSLDQAYGRYSYAKARAWEHCKRLQEAKKGTDLKVVSHNSSFFTAGFKFVENGKEKFMYITKFCEVAVDWED